MKNNKPIEFRKSKRRPRCFMLYDYYVPRIAAPYVYNSTKILKLWKKIKN